MNPENTTTVQQSDEQSELTSESLLEEISIDGMCGVY